MQDYSLIGRWSQRHDRAFLQLKKVLTSEPVLRCPSWDGRPFIVTSDGCKEGFGAVLTQRFDTTLPSGTTVTRLHPIAFASKRTSRSEENYKPFFWSLLHLNMLWTSFLILFGGFQLRLRLIGQALRDVLINDKHNAAHARWRDGILAHQIVDVRHVPGKINVSS